MSKIEWFNYTKLFKDTLNLILKKPVEVIWSEDDDFTYICLYANAVYRLPKPLCPFDFKRTKCRETNVVKDIFKQVDDYSGEHTKGTLSQTAIHLDDKKVVRKIYNKLNEDEELACYVNEKYLKYTEGYEVSYKISNPKYPVGICEAGGLIIACILPINMKNTNV